MISEITSITIKSEKGNFTLRKGIHDNKILFYPIDVNYTEEEMQEINRLMKNKYIKKIFGQVL